MRGAGPIDPPFDLYLWRRNTDPTGSGLVKDEPPYRSPSPPAHCVAEPVEPGRGGAGVRRGTVLVVDADTASMASLTGMLAEAGYRVLSASSGAAALGLAASAAPI